MDRGASGSSKRPPTSSGSFAINELNTTFDGRGESIFVPKPTLTSSYSSPDLSAFRIKASTMEDRLDSASFQINNGSGSDLDDSVATMTYSVCRYFMQGYCSRGDRCNYAHIMNMNSLSGNSRPTTAHPSSSSGGLPAFITNTVSSSTTNANTLPSATLGPNSLSSIQAYSAYHQAQSVAVSAGTFNPALSGMNQAKFQANLQKQRKHSQEEGYYTLICCFVIALFILTLIFFYFV